MITMVVLPFSKLFNFIIRQSIIFIALIFFSYAANAQQQPNPRIAGYFSITNTIAIWNKYGITTNFSDSYTVSFHLG